MRLRLTSLLLLLALWGQGQAAMPNDTVDRPAEPELNRNRLTAVLTGSALLYAGSMYALNEAWYKDYPRSGFHFHNDNAEWLGIDKLGHVTTSYYLGIASYEALRWAGVSERTSAVAGGAFGFGYMSVIEILDGFSRDWGASPGDILANTLGTGLFIGQQLTWQEQRMLLKVSYSPTDYAQYNPKQLGGTHLERLLKDYNGHTLWLSANVHSFMADESRFPKWLNVAVGYGADGMIGARNNAGVWEGQTFPDDIRKRSIYLSLDIDLTRIKTKSSLANLLLKSFGFIHLPMPAIEFKQGGTVKLHPLFM